MNRQRGHRPNRNRGRGHGPSQPQNQPQQSMARKNKEFDDDDLDDFDYEPEEEESSEDDEWELEEDEDFVAIKDPAKPAERRKVEMQILHMSEQSQQSVIQMLKEIHGSQFKIKDASSYVDAGQRIDRRFWVKDRLRVTNVIKFDDKDEVAEADQFALKKLESYGFHRSRCLEALQKTDDDAGQAFELLMNELFDLIGIADNEASDDNAKEDEKLAIQSIYGDGALIEKIPGKLWEIKLTLPPLLEVLKSQINDGSKGATKSKAVVTRQELEKDKNACQFFLRGHCKFGARCFKKHVTPDKDSLVDDKHLRLASAHENEFILEIRFPDKCSYPMSPPLASFMPMSSKIPRQACLKITARLMEEAKILAQDQVPSVFSLINLLENTDEMKKAVEGQDVKFSFAIGLEPAGSQTGNEQSRLMASLGITDSNDKCSDSRNELSIRRSRDMKKDDAKILERYKKRSVNKTMLETRQALPAWKEQDSIIKALHNHQILVISGMTGCGKSTQVPQYILDSYLAKGQVPNIICTQPRRISAIGVADRVAQERDEKIGNVIGYQIRLESKTSSLTRLLFCTTGILLRRLESDPELKDVSHVIIDEVHERSEESDFLLMIVRDLLPKRPDLKVLLMSATLNASIFANYFKGQVPVIDIPGRTFPVTQYYLEEILDYLEHFTVEENSTYAKRRPRQENFARKKINKMGKDIFLDDYDAEMLLNESNQDDFKPPKDSMPDEKLEAKQIHYRYQEWSEKVKRNLSVMDFEKINYDLIEAVLVHILDEGDYPKQGSILVFLPGMQEIMTLFDQIGKNPTISKACKILPLHSSLSSEEQSLIFSKMKLRKLVLSTNLAETSITIDDCVFVIETGKMKEKRFDPSKNMESLDTIWVSQANAMQRKGRAGRVMSGICFHLYTKFRYDHHLRPFPIPEIQRVPLEQMLLRIKIMPLFHDKPRVKEVLKHLIEPPALENVSNALERLRGVGALDDHETLTPLGFHLASLPVDVRIGKLMLLGSVFKCLDSALTMAACLSFKSPFVSPFNKRDEAKKKRQEFALWSSDQITDLQAYNAWRTAQKISFAAGYAFTQENYLSIRTLQTIVSMKHQFAELLASIGFIHEQVSSRRLDKAGKNGTDGIEILTSPEINANNKSGKLLVSLLCSALYPNVIQILSPKTKFKQTVTGAMAKVTAIEDLRFRTKKDGYVHIHPSSVIAQAGQSLESAYIVFHEKVKTSRIFVRECSLVPIYSMVLFGGYGVEIELQRGQFVLSLEDGWIKFVTFSHVIAECLKEMRRELDNLLEEKIANPEMDLSKNVRGKLIIDTIVNLIQKE